MSTGRASGRAAVDSTATAAPLSHEVRIERATSTTCAAMRDDARGGRPSEIASIMSWTPRPRASAAPREVYGTPSQAPRPRLIWSAALLTAYVCGGWPGLVVVTIWRFSADRAGLREEWAHLHRRNVEARAQPPPARPGEAEHEIVLADYEDEPEDRPAEAPRSPARPGEPPPT